MNNKNDIRVVFVVVLVVSSIISFFAGRYFGNKNGSIFDYSYAKEININKINNNKEIVYSKEIYIPDKLPEDLNTDEVKSELPIINLNYDSVKEVNKKIENEYKRLKDENIITDDMVNINSLKYKYYVNGDILSLIIEYKNYNYTALYVTYNYKTYNIDKTNGKVLSNKEIINLKKITEEDVYDKIIENIEQEYKNLEYDNYKNMDFYKETINNIKKDNNIISPLFLDDNNNLNIYLNIRMNMGPGKTTRNFILK